MAKKQETKKEVEVPVVETPVVEAPKPKKVELKKPEWEIKDRIYYLKGNKKPISYSMKSSGIYFFDEKKGYERELKYCENQTTPFVDEMKGDQRLAHIIFRDGNLFVAKEKTVLQKLLSLYHPHKDKLFYEYNPIQEASQDIEILELEADAIVIARNIDIDQAEAILRVEMGSKVSEMSSKEIKRDLLIFAKQDAKLFIDLAKDDNVQLRNFAIKATEAGIIHLADDQRTFKWSSNNKKLMTVPFDEHPYAAMAAFFKTDEGLEIYKSIEKKLS